MKLFKFLQGSLLALAIIALVGISQKAQAQYNLNPVTVSLNQQEFQAAVAFGVVPVAPVTPVHFIGKGVGTGTGTGWPPPLDPPCIEQMTPELAQHMRDLANQYCQDMLICVQGSNCAWYLYVFRPTDPRCWTLVYQSVLKAYAL
jgi:hypothetical protein